MRPPRLGGGTRRPTKQTLTDQDIEMTTYRFKEVTHPVTKRVDCRVCGKKVTRSTTLSQTVSPFNKDADGQPKTAEQIRAELRAEAETWQPRNDIHAACTGIEEIEAAARDHGNWASQAGKATDS